MKADIKNSSAEGGISRWRFVVRGVVQGVGFRPFVYRAAKKFRITGWIKNTSQGVVIEAEGHRVDPFIRYVQHNPPPLAVIDRLQATEIPRQFSDAFTIASSENSNLSEVWIPPDIAVCKNCRAELASATDRRHGYPLINCTDCGPRFTIIRNLPYDRPQTTMKNFPMCPQCQKEYADPANRRYHAQPISCFQCGPVFQLSGHPAGHINELLGESVKLLKKNFVVAIKGIGGYHLACRAFSDAAVTHLRQLKRREEKPLAMMGTLAMVRQHCLVSKKETDFLCSIAAPIVLLKKKQGSPISQLVAPHQRYWGFLLPYTPLHDLLLEKMAEPLVLTSANISDEPIIYRDESPELQGLADAVLFHDRPIEVFADDSVARIFAAEPFFIRRSRGYAPLPIELPESGGRNVLAVGAMMKTTFTILQGRYAMMSQHIGDTESPQAVDTERQAIRHFLKVFSFEPEIVAVDCHPAYSNRDIAYDFPALAVRQIQHHRAHVAALLAEKKETAPIIGLALDGTGYGDDGKIWGGEFFLGDYKELRRAGHFRYVFLPGGDNAIRDPWRFALSLLHEIHGLGKVTVDFAGRWGQAGERQLETISKQLGGILTSSCGRLFDAVSSLAGIGHHNHFEGELPMLLQMEAEGARASMEHYPFSIFQQDGEYILDFLPAIAAFIRDTRKLSRKAYIFHVTIAEGLSQAAERLRESSRLNLVGLTGGVFQNLLLLRLTREKLRQKKFNVISHTRVPTNDGGISLGQALLASHVV